jgi:hypothetical protein
MRIRSTVKKAHMACFVLIGAMLSVGAPGVVLADLVSENAYDESSPPTTTMSSKKSQKIARMLDAMGMNNESVKAFVEYVDTRTRDKYFALSESRVMGGKLKLGYDLHDGVHPGKPELRYTPDNSNMSYVANRDGAIASYSLHF